MNCARAESRAGCALLLSKIRLFFFIEPGEEGRGTSGVETSVKLTELNERKKAALGLLAKYGGRERGMCFAA